MAKTPRSLTENQLNSQCVYEGNFLHMHADKVMMLMVNYLSVNMLLTSELL